MQLYVRTPRPDLLLVLLLYAVRSSVPALSHMASGRRVMQCTMCKDQKGKRRDSSSRSLLFSQRLCHFLYLYLYLRLHGWNCICSVFTCLALFPAPTGKMLPSQFREHAPLSLSYFSQENKRAAIWSLSSHEQQSCPGGTGLSVRHRLSFLISRFLLLPEPAQTRLFIPMDSCNEGYSSLFVPVLKQT